MSGTKEQIKSGTINFYKMGYLKALEECLEHVMRAPTLTPKQMNRFVVGKTNIMLKDAEKQIRKEDNLAKYLDLFND